jgi:hypothetical protein
MGEINLEAHEVRAIQSVDMAKLRRLVQDAIGSETASGLHDLRLWDCGEFVGERLRRFQVALAEHAKAKSAAKRERTGSDAHRAGSALVSAVDSMKDRQEKDEKRDQLFRVDDHIRPPYRFSPRLSVTVSFQWRLSVDDGWTYGRIVFTHDVDTSPNYERLHHLSQMGRTRISRTSCRAAGNTSCAARSTQSGTISRRTPTVRRSRPAITAAAP